MQSLKKICIYKLNENILWDWRDNTDILQLAADPVPQSSPSTTKCHLNVSEHGQGGVSKSRTAGSDKYLEILH